MNKPVKFVEPVSNDATRLQQARATGHLRRTGHTLDSLQVSADGMLWHRVYTCCGDTIPAEVPVWDEVTPAPEPHVHTGFEAGAI